MPSKPKPEREAKDAKKGAVPRAKKAAPKKSSPKARPARPRGRVRPQDDPIAASAGRSTYTFDFDPDSLTRAIDAGPGVADACAVLADEVRQSVPPDVAARLASADPAWSQIVAGVIQVIVEGCPEARVVSALGEIRDDPKGLRARHTVMALARRLPGIWRGDALEVAWTMVNVGILRIDTDAVAILYPGTRRAGGEPAAPEPGPDPVPGPGLDPGPGLEPEPVYGPALASGGNGAHAAEPAPAAVAG
jgi:hypothetical protein